MAGLTRYSTLAATLRQRNFALYLWGGWPALVGMWVHRVAVGWLTWELTHSGTWLGLIAVADLAPTVFVTPLAGVIADRMDRRMLAIYSQALAMLQAVAPKSPNLNAYAERFVRSIKEECLHRVVPLGEAHLRLLVPRVRRILPSRKKPSGSRQPAPATTATSGQPGRRR